MPKAVFKRNTFDSPEARAPSEEGHADRRLDDPVFRLFSICQFTPDPVPNMFGVLVLVSDSIAIDSSVRSIDPDAGKDPRL